MRIHSLDIEGFGPFKDLQSINFDALSQDKIFMLEGPTGAGKSSIIDAIVYALYGMTAHEAATKGGPSGNRVRSDYCEPDAETKVSMEFTTGGVRYRISRVAPYEAPKKSGEGTRPVNAKATLEFMNPVKEAITQVREVNMRIADVLQMDHDQFSQMVVLPQGDFASFLHASNEKRREVLESIFKTFFYDRIKGNLDVTAKRIQLELANHAQEIRRHVKNLQDEATTYSENIDFTNLESILLDANLERQRKDQSLATVTSSIRPDGIADAAAKIVIEEELAPLSARQLSLEESAGYIAAKELLDLELKGLSNQEEEIVQLEALVKLHGKVLPLSAIVETRKGACEAMEEALDAIPEDYQEMTAEEVRARIKSLAKAMPPLAKKSDEAQAAAERIEDVESQIENSQEIEEAIIEAPKLVKKVEKFQSKVKSTEAKIKDYRKMQKDSAVLEVAKLLKDGRPCPVCGSTEHPKPLKGKNFDESILDQLAYDLEELRGELVDAKSDLLTATKLSKKAFKPAAELKVIKKALEAKAAQADEISEQYESAQEELTDLTDSQQFFSDYEVAEKSALHSQAKIEEQLEKLQIDEDAAIAILDIELDSINLKIANHRDRIKEIKALVNQEIYRGLPNYAKLEGEIGLLTSKIESLSHRLSEVTDRLAVLTRINEKIDASATGISDSLDQISQIRGEGEPYLNLQDWVSGKNAAGLSLTNYVLQERLEMILEYASRHLRRISNGKYEFRLFEEKVGRNQKAGLGITVMDYFAGKERPAETLSGGETFYASLALALGLVEVVKADNGGIELGTLFIDEGFGSLSDDTLEEVIDVLEDLRAERIIGIISHVEGMKTQIPMRLEVRHSEEGPSFVRMTAAGMK
jgi:DNA repair protein SbcC/Rad50